MSALAKRKLYLAAAALFLGAIAAQVRAKHHVGDGMTGGPPPVPSSINRVFAPWVRR